MVATSTLVEPGTVNQRFKGSEMTNWLLNDLNDRKFIIVLRLLLICPQYQRRLSLSGSEKWLVLVNPLMLIVNQVMLIKQSVCYGTCMTSLIKTVQICLPSIMTVSKMILYAIITIHHNVTKWPLLVSKTTSNQFKLANKQHNYSTPLYDLSYSD